MFDSFSEMFLDAFNANVSEFVFLVRSYMCILKYLFGTLLILLAIFVIGGFLIPDEWEISRSNTIHANAERIYPFVSNFKEWENWSPWNASKDATLKYSYEDSETVVGAKQSWTSEKMGNGWMKFTAASQQSGVSYDLFIDMGRMQSTLHGNIAFSPEGDETRLTWTDRGNSDKSWIKRWMSILIKPMLRKDLDSGLAGLKELVEKQN